MSSVSLRRLERDKEEVLVRIVDKIRRMQKIGFAAPYAQHGDCTRQIRKVYFAVLLKTEGMSRRDLAGCTHTSKLKMSSDHG